VNFAQAPEKVLREFEVRNVVLGVSIAAAVAVFTRDPGATGSVLAGLFLSLLLFQYLKKDGRWIASQAMAGVPHGKIVRGFLIKYYLRLLVVGFLMGFAFYFRILHPLYLTLGLSVVVIQGFLVVAEALFNRIFVIARKEVVHE